MHRLVLGLLLSVAVISPASAQVEKRLPENQAELQLSYASVVKRVAPSVVNVYATRMTQARSRTTGDPFFDQFFGRSPLFQQRPQTSQSLGSGVIVQDDGLILTNNHVVEGATDIRVVLSDGREYVVDLVLADSSTDLAVLKIKNPTESFPAVSFSNSSSLEVGDIVLAIGNPFGVGQSVTSGIVSALARTGMGITDYQFFIQTDAAINPGNSGGALVDLAGNLVGVNTAIFTRSGGSNGIGFAIPADMAQVIVNAALNGGEIVRPWLGAQLQLLDNDLAKGLGLPTPRGALITETALESAAYEAGLKSGDVILSVDGVEIQDPEALNYRLATKPIGSISQFLIHRNGENITLSVEMKTAPSLEGRTVTISGNTRFSGITASSLTPALSQELGLGFQAEGVVLTDVAMGSPAQMLGLRKGDIILSLNEIAIRDIETLESLAQTRPRNWQIEIQRSGNIIRSFVSG